MKKTNIICGLLLVVAVCSTIVVAAMPAEKIVHQNGENCNRIYDVNRDGRINYQDAGLCFVYVRDNIDDPYGNLLYDVNIDGVVDDSDYLLIWQNRD